MAYTPSTRYSTTDGTFIPPQLLLQLAANPAWAAMTAGFSPRQPLVGALSPALRMMMMFSLLIARSLKSSPWSQTGYKNASIQNEIAPQYTRIYAYHTYQVHTYQYGRVRTSCYIPGTWCDIPSRITFFFLCFRNVSMPKKLEIRVRSKKERK